MVRRGPRRLFAWRSHVSVCCPFWDRMPNAEEQLSCAKMPSHRGPFPCHARFFPSRRRTVSFSCVPLSRHPPPPPPSHLSYPPGSFRPSHYYCRNRMRARNQGYRYSLCPFKDAKQDKHSLGRWRGWAGPERAGPGDAHRSMLFDGGSRCHNKKQRCVASSGVVQQLCTRARPCTRDHAAGGPAVLCLCRPCARRIKARTGRGAVSKEEFVRPPHLQPGINISAAATRSFVIACSALPLILGLRDGTGYWPT